MHSDKYIFFFIDCNTLFRICRKDFCKFSVYIEIDALDLILSGRECETEVEILVSIDSRDSAFFERAHDGDEGSGVFIFECYFDAIGSGIPVFIDGTECEGMFSAEIFIEIYGRNFIYASGIRFREREFLE